MPLFTIFLRLIWYQEFSFDISLNNFKFLTIIINHGKRKINDIVNVYMFLNACYINLLISRGSTKSPCKNFFIFYLNQNKIRESRTSKYFLILLHTIGLFQKFYKKSNYNTSRENWRHWSWEKHGSPNYLS